MIAIALTVHKFERTTDMFRRLLAGLWLALSSVAAFAQLTPQQVVSLRAAVFADPTAAAFVTGGNAAGLRGYLNGASATSAWHTYAPVSGLLDAINWAQYTPTDAVAGADTDPLLTRKIGWMLSIKIKQTNLQLMLQGRDTINCAPPNVRAGLRDAVIQVPSGAGGAATSPGGASGVTLLARCQRVATRAEIMLATAAQGSDTTGGLTSRVLTYQGDVSEVDSVRLIFRDDGTIWTP